MRARIFVLRLYYACTTGANFKPGAGRGGPRGTFLYYVCTTLVLREQISSQEPAYAETFGSESLRYAGKMKARTFQSGTSHGIRHGICVCAN